MQYDLIVIGGGPAGYVGAIRAAQLGKSVVCVERDRVGGTCLNWGCIPTKALLKNAEAYRIVTDRAREFGMMVEGVSVDWSEVIGRSRKVSDRLAGGVGFLFKKNKVDSVTGEASIISPRQGGSKGRRRNGECSGGKEYPDLYRLRHPHGAQPSPERHYCHRLQGSHGAGKAA